MASSNQMIDCNAQQVPEVVVKNTFLDFDMSESKSSVGYQSQSCPAEVFSPSQAKVCSDGGKSLADSLAGISDMRMCDLAAAAQMFSNLKISRTKMESCGHVASRGSDSSQVDTFAERTWGFDSFSSMDFQDAAAGIGGPVPQFKPPPPPLSAACFSEAITPEAPNWTPKCEKVRNRPVPPPLCILEQETSSGIPAVPAWTPKVGADLLPSLTPTVETGDATPEAPAWTPKVGSVGTAMLQGPAPPPAPAPAMLQGPAGPPALAPMILSAPVPAPAQAPAFAPIIPFTQEQLDVYSFCSQDLTVPLPIPSAAPLPQVWWYRVSFLGGIALRNAPSVDADRTGHMLYQNETFAVSERIQGADGRVYLLLADFRGWAFDDSALMPHDPSVVRGRWSQMDASISYQSAAPMMVFEQSLIVDGNEQSKRRRRRKRGGVKRNKNKRAQAAALLAKAEACDDVDTDAPSEDDDDAPLADSSSSNGAEAEGTEMFKEEDFPQLV